MHDGFALGTDEEKGRAFLMRYRGQLQQASEEQLKNKWEEIHQRILKKKVWEKEPKVSEAEMRNIIKGIEKDTTPGPDRVVYADLNTIADDDTLLFELVELVNTTLKEGEIPIVI